MEHSTLLTLWVLVLGIAQYPIQYPYHESVKEKWRQKEELHIICEIPNVGLTSSGVLFKVVDVQNVIPPEEGRENYSKT